MKKAMAPDEAGTFYQLQTIVADTVYQAIHCINSSLERCQYDEEVGTMAYIGGPTIKFHRYSFYIWPYLNILGERHKIREHYRKAGWYECEITKFHYSSNCYIVTLTKSVSVKEDGE